MNKLFERLKPAFGPILGGLIIDFTDLATFGPIGIYMGAVIGGAVGYWICSLYQLPIKQKMIGAMLAAIYCSIPSTEFIPAATLLGAFIRFSSPRFDAGLKEAGRGKERRNVIDVKAVVGEEFSAGGIVFRTEGEEICYLLVYSGRNKRWGFPKGHIKRDEDENITALREIEEEAGLRDLRLVKGFRSEDVYEAISRRGQTKGKIIKKHSIYFLFETSEKEIKVDGREITDYRWLRLKEALKLISFDSAKEILRQADRFPAKAA
ncbi:MAG: NUDIX domain-containing protein [Candidatus Omnitrophica bacterium]|nr:NUDIX domain-containing protein [Candidatus Omnitrophota bacterium]MBU4478614.1 NUDIX domain-containing protein [Candidatus Omnitrophota bacterium]